MLRVRAPPTAAASDPRASDPECDRADAHEHRAVDDVVELALFENGAGEPGRGELCDEVTRHAGEHHAKAEEGGNERRHHARLALRKTKSTATQHDERTENGQTVEDEERNEFLHLVATRGVGPRQRMLQLGCTTERSNGEDARANEKDCAQRMTTSACDGCNFGDDAHADCRKHVGLRLRHRPAEPVVHALVSAERQTTIVVVDVEIDRGADDDGQGEKQRYTARQRCP